MRYYCNLRQGVNTQIHVISLGVLSKWEHRLYLETDSANTCKSLYSGICYVLLLNFKIALQFNMGKKGKKGKDGSAKGKKKKGGKKGKKAGEPQMTWKEALLAYQ